MNPIRCVAYCPHCGNRAPQRLVHVQRFLTCGYRSDGTREDYECPSAHYVAVCETCSEVLLYLDEFDDFGEKSFIKASIVWPEPKALHHSVPSRVRDCYEEADRIRHFAPNGFATLIGRTLEAMCDDRHIPKGKLEHRLKELAERKEIPPELAKMTHVLRRQRNIGAHADEDSVKPGHVRIIDDFFRVVVEYVYVAPCKLREFEDQLRPQA